MEKLIFFEKKLKIEIIAKKKKKEVKKIKFKKIFVKRNLEKSKKGKALKKYYE